MQTYPTELSTLPFAFRIRSSPNSVGFGQTFPPKSQEQDFSCKIYSGRCNASFLESLQPKCADSKDHRQAHGCKYELLKNVILLLISSDSPLIQMKASPQGVYPNYIPVTVIQCHKSFKFTFYILKRSKYLFCIYFYVRKKLQDNTANYCSTSSKPS